MHADGTLQLEEVRPPAPWVAAWPLADLVVCPDGDGFYALEAGGRVLHFDWDGDGRPRQVAPALPWRCPQPFIERVPHTRQTDSRIIALPRQRVVRFVSTEVRHVKNPSEVLVEVWRLDGTCERRLRARGVMAVLLAVRGDGVEVHLGWPGRYAADPWPSLWVPLPETADPADIIDPSARRSTAVADIIDLPARWSAAVDGGDARRLREAERQAARPQPYLPPEMASCLPVPPHLWALSLDGASGVVAAGGGLVVKARPTAPWTCGEPPPRVADGFPRLEHDVLREHLPPPLGTCDGQFTLQVSRDWEMVDPYSSADVWSVVITDRSSAAPPRVARLPEQPVAWAGEPTPNRLLLRGVRGEWMCVDAEWGDAFLLGGDGVGDRVAFSRSQSQPCFDEEQREEGASGRNPGPIITRLGEMRWRARRTPTIETFDLVRRRLIQTRPCGPAELPLGLSDDGDLVLLQDGASLRFLRMSDGAASIPTVLDGDEADSARWCKSGFVVATRRGARFLIR